jgi:hypothetical protein
MEIAATVRNWMIEAVAAPILIQIDDDFRGVKAATSGPGRFITDPNDILAILENAAVACSDLGLTTFCFAGTANVSLTKPDHRPISPLQPVFRAFGIMGKARHRKWRTDIPGRADTDWTLRTLLEDRCVYADVRFFFDCGPVFSGRGGNVGLIDAEAFEKSTRELCRTWGRHVSFKVPNFVKKREVASISIRVSRTNKLAQR